MRQAAANRPARANSGVADPADRLGEQRLFFGQRAVALDRRLAGHGADGRAPITRPDVGQLGDAVQVHEQRRARQSKVQQRDQALAACQQLGVCAALCERRHRLVE